jgi:hypothetical protein
MVGEYLISSTDSGLSIENALDGALVDDIVEVRFSLLLATEKTGCIALPDVEVCFRFRVDVGFVGEPPFSAEWTAKAFSTSATTRAFIVSSASSGNFMS